MPGFEKITIQIIKLMLLMGIGFFAGKTRYVPEEAGAVLSKIVIKITVPLLIVFTLANRSFTHQELVNGLWIYSIGFVLLLVSLALFSIVLWILKTPQKTASIHKMQAMFGNVIFMAYPLLFSVYGDVGIAYAVFFNLANDTLLWTIGIYLINQHKKTSWKENLRHLINANTISFAIGILCMLLHIKDKVAYVPALKAGYSLLYDTFYPLGETTIYLSMLFIGLILSGIQIDGIRDIKRRLPVFFLSIFKLLLMPYATLIILQSFFGFLNPVTRQIIILQMAMPCATIVPALALQHDADYLSATENVFFSTILSMATIPLFVYLLKI